MIIFLNKTERYAFFIKFKTKPEVREGMINSSIKGGDQNGLFYIYHQDI